LSRIREAETVGGPTSSGSILSLFTPAGLAIGLATGFLSGLMGVGGGIIAVPAMVGILHVSQHKAHGTSLAMMVMTATAAALTYLARGQVDVTLAVILSFGTVVGAYFGARLMARLPAHQLRLAFGVFILFVGLRMTFSWLQPPGSQVTLTYSPEQVALILLLGLLAGALAGLLGIGGGVILVPAMAFLLGIDQHTAQGVSLVVIVPTAISGALTHYRRGNVIPRLALSLGLAAIFGALLGSWLSSQLNASALQTGFGIFVVVVAVRSLVTEIRASRARAVTS
jgi:uncharacterized protein